MGERNWYIVEGGESIGPFDESALRQRVRDGLLGSDDLIWQEGMVEWTKAGEVPGLLPPPVSAASIESSSPTPPPVPKKPQPSVDDRTATPETPRIVEEEAHSEPTRIGRDTSSRAADDAPDLDRLCSTPPTQAHANDCGLSYAGFWKRLAALVIDYIIMFGSMFALFFALGLLLAIGGATNTYSGEDWEAIANCASFLGFWLYFAGMESSGHQGTLGKLVLGIKVTDMSGRPIGFGRACGRHFSKIISGIILGIGYLIAAFTPKKQALHDMIAGCLVVNK